MLSDTHILEHAARMGYASIYIGTTKLGPGRSHWESTLPLLTTEQRAILEEKIERFEARLERRKVIA